MMDRPPCWQDGKKQNPCALAHYERVVHGHTDLRADWLGWKQRGRYLVAPDGQRISPERMRGIMWRLDAEARRDAARARNAKRKVSQGQVKVVVVDLADWQARTRLPHSSRHRVQAHSTSPPIQAKLIPIVKLFCSEYS